MAKHAYMVNGPSEEADRLPMRNCEVGSLVFERSNFLIDLNLSQKFAQILSFRSFLDVSLISLTQKIAILSIVLCNLSLANRLSCVRSSPKKKITKCSVNDKRKKK